MSFVSMFTILFSPFFPVSDHFFCSGKFAFSSPFNQIEIQLKTNDSIYLSSDGYPDQFGGEKGRKFMYKPFKRLFLDIHNETMEKQQSSLINSFEAWRGSQEQVDDVCVIGVKV